jgi:hypothetical protein
MTNLKYSQLIKSELLYIEEVNHYQKAFIVDDVFDILSIAYQDVVGGLHFVDTQDLLDNTDRWQIIYLDTQIIGAVIYKAKRGLKMVALGLSNFISKKIQYLAKNILGKFLQQSLRYTWTEVSESAERFMMKYGGRFYQISNAKAKEFLDKDIQLCDDGYHYTRTIQGIQKTKIILGNPNNNIK